MIQIDFIALHDLPKATLEGVVRELGLRRDWARVNKPEMVAMIRPFSAEQIAAACRATGDFSGAEMATLVRDSNEAPATPVAVAVAAAVAPAAPAAPAAPDVAQVAGLLAQLLATNKGTVDADGVRALVDPMLGRQAKDLLDTVSGWVIECGQDAAKMMDSKLAAMPAREIIIKSDRAEVKISGLQHMHFERLLRSCSARKADGHRLNVYLYGAPGTGKTTAARNVAQALGLAFHCNGAVSTKYELTGFIDANGVCHSPEFRKAWQSGGVYLFDEIDGSVASAIVAFNAALANGVMSFPDGMIERHADCVIIAAGNTVHGATAEFTGRTKLDAASLDRFVMIAWGIDTALEAALAGDRIDWLKEVRRVRRLVADKGIKVMITPRAVIDGVALLGAGMTFEDARELVLRKGMNDQQWELVA